MGKRPGQRSSDDESSSRPIRQQETLTGLVKAWGGIVVALVTAIYTAGVLVTQVGGLETQMANFAPKSSIQSLAAQLTELSRKSDLRALELIVAEEKARNGRQQEFIRAGEAQRQQNKLEIELIKQAAQNAARERGNIIKGVDNIQKILQDRYKPKPGR